MDYNEKEVQFQQDTPVQSSAPMANPNYFRAAADLSDTWSPARSTSAAPAAPKPNPVTAPQNVPYPQNVWGGTVTTQMPYAAPNPYSVPNSYAAPNPYMAAPKPYAPVMPPMAPPAPPVTPPVAPPAPPVTPPVAPPAPPVTPPVAPPEIPTPDAAKPVAEKSEELPKKSGKGRVWLTVAAVTAALGLVVGGCLVTAKLIDQKWEQKYTQMSTIHNQQVRDLQDQIDAKTEKNSTGRQPTGGITAPAEGILTPSQVYAQNVDAVVAIKTTVRGGYSMGSGFIMTADGYVTTNYHVVNGAKKIEVMTHDGTAYPAELVGYDNTNDVAVLKMEGKGFPCVTVGVSESLIVGDQVVAIGNPLGELTNTLTVGYVSAKERDVNTDGITINMIQTDAAINSGNSGGPLFNMYGEVVGITTAKYSGESSSGATIEGIGFAIPIDDVYDLIQDLINDGYVSSAYLGVLVSEMNAEAAAYYGYPVGALVQEVTPGYCAEKAGLKAEDIIVALGTHKVKGLSDLTRILRNMEPGETTTVTVWRDGEELVLEITLDEKPAETVTSEPNGEMPENGSYEEWYEYFKDYFGNGE